MIESYSNTSIIDGHVDLLYEMTRNHNGIPFDRITDSPVTIERLKRGNVRIIVSAYYCPDEYNGGYSAAEYLENLFNISELYLTGLKHVKSANEFVLCFNGGEETGIISLIENADALLEMGIEKLEKKGIKVVGLTHSGRNRIGDGNSIKYPNKITNDGKALVKSLDDSGFAIDLAHLSETCFMELCDIFKGPIISSHTGLRKFYDIPRNLSQKQTDIILHRGGLIGITINPEMLSGDKIADIIDVFQNIDFIVQKYNANSVALGSDLCGFDFVNQGIPDISYLNDLAEIFDKHGYTSESIRKIMGENWLRFYCSLLS
ncbi:MAG: membrane dipeptidase [Spirochaetota bacterium]|nr:membrane dipeptidase [Spirochaetota bacterium]